VAKLDMSGGALSYSLSLEVDPLPNVPLTFAVDYKHQAVQELDGDVEWTGLTPLATALGNAGPAAGAAAIFKNQGVEETLTIPNLLNIGVAYRVIPSLLLTAGFTWDRWVVYDQDLFVADNGAVLAVPRDYSNGQTYRVGAEYTLNRSIELRAGLQRDESGLSEAVYSPTLPDGSSWAGSLGATYKFGRGFSVDAVVFYAVMDDVEVPSSAAGLEPQATPPSTFVAQPTGTFRGEYSPSALVYGLGLAWTPGARTPAE
jgi:long-chain fatty acid transport protein